MPDHVGSRNVVGSGQARPGCSTAVGLESVASGRDGPVLLMVSAVCDLHLNLFCLCDEHGLSRIVDTVRQ